MELRTLARDILFTPTLEARLFFPEQDLSALTDMEPGQPQPWRDPLRPAHLQIAPKKQRKPLPSPRALHDPVMRVRCLHTFANHELMALELMAWALLAFPHSPPAFRRGLAWLIKEEQEHLRLYIERIAQLGASFGDLPLNDHFWRLAPLLDTPLKWVCAMNLTFEQANLDHAPVFARHFREAGDVESAALMDQITEDEIKHVGFGVRWLQVFSGEPRASFESFVQNLTPYNDATRARGEHMNVEARRRAGLDEDFISALAQSS